MEIDWATPRAIDVRKRATMLDKTTLLDTCICILDLDKFMSIKMKQNYDKHVERLKFWKDISKEEERVDKAWFITLFFMKWEAPIPNIMLEFLNFL